MATVTLVDAQANLAELVNHLAPGEEVVITRNDQPVAKLISTSPPVCVPVFGRGKGKVLHWVDDDEHLKDFAGYM